MNKEENILYNILDEDINTNNPYNYRKNGENVTFNIGDNVFIEAKDNNLKINVKDNTTDEIIQIPVIVTKEGFKDEVHNEYNIGKNVSVTIKAGCAIENKCLLNSMHSGIHIFNIGENSAVNYIEKHYGCGRIGGKEINTKVKIKMDKNSSLNIDTYQISGVDISKRKTEAKIGSKSFLKINEKLLTTNTDNVVSSYKVLLNGENSKVDIISRSVASGNSTQEFKSEIIGNNKSFGHVECDAITMNNAKVTSIPKIVSNNIDALLSHEAVVGKISSEQILKLETLGLTKEEAEQEIINSFMN